MTNFDLICLFSSFGACKRKSLFSEDPAGSKKRKELSDSEGKNVENVISNPFLIYSLICLIKISMEFK